MDRVITVVCPDGRFYANLDICVAKSRYLAAMFRPDSDGNPRTREAVEGMIRTSTRLEVVRSIFLYMHNGTVAIQPGLFQQLYHEVDVYMLDDLRDRLDRIAMADPKIYMSCDPQTREQILSLQE